MTKVEKIKEFISTLNNLDKCIDETISVGNKYEFLSYYGTKNLYEFKSLVEKTIEHTSKELEKENE